MVLSSQKKEKMELDDDERIARFVTKQIERAGGADVTAPSATALQRQSDEEKVAFKLGGDSATGGGGSGGGAGGGGVKKALEKTANRCGYSLVCDRKNSKIKLS